MAKRLTKVLFASRHSMSDGQLEDAQRIFGNDIIITTEAILFTDVESVKDLASEYDVVIAVLPAHLAIQVGSIATPCRAGMIDCTPCVYSADCPERAGMWARRIWVSESRPVQAADGEQRLFEHVAFHQAGVTV